MAQKKKRTFLGSQRIDEAATLPKSARKKFNDDAVKAAKKAQEKADAHAAVEKKFA